MGFVLYWSQVFTHIHRSTNQNFVMLQNTKRIIMIHFLHLHMSGSQCNNNALKTRFLKSVPVYTNPQKH